MTDNEDEYVPNGQPQRFLVRMDSTLRSILLRKDTDADCLMTINDTNSTVVSAGTMGSHVFDI